MTEMESLLWTGANTASLARAGRMDTSPTEGNSAQALEAWHDDVPGAAGPWRVGKDGTNGGGE